MTARTLGNLFLNDLPVYLVDANGNPVNISAGSTYSHISTHDTNLVVIKSGAGVLLGIDGFSESGANGAWIKLYDKATAPVLASDTPIARRKIIPLTGGAGFIKPYPQGVAFTNGLAMAITGLIADTDTTAVASADFAVNVDFL